jgi:hypothetical protein
MNKKSNGVFNFSLLAISKYLFYNEKYEEQILIKIQPILDDKNNLEKVFHNDITQNTLEKVDNIHEVLKL